MNIRIIAVGKLKEKYLEMGINEYLKRLQTYAKVEIVEVKEESLVSLFQKRAVNRFSNEKETHLRCDS